MECTANAHCTADPNKAKCSAANVCVDSVPPTITIGAIKRTHSETRTSLATPESLGTAGSGQWLKGGVYEISLTVQDTGSSGLDTGYGPVVIRSRGDDDTFDTQDDKTYLTDWIGDNKFSVWVGPDDDSSHPSYSTVNDCVDEEPGRCKVEIYARDLAGNYTTPFPLIRNLNIDYTTPRAP